MWAALIAVVVAGDAIDGYIGLATEPTTGIVYGAVNLVSATTRKDRTLITIDVASLTATVVGPLSQNGVADLTFLPDGTLLAMTGDGASVPETLWSVDKASGTMTFIANLGNGNDGEVIARVPAILGGTLTVAAVNGVAHFTVQIDGPGDYSLKASSAAAPDLVSAPFTLQ